MRFDILTLFPDAVDAMMQSSILGRAQKKGLLEIHAHQIRDYTTSRQNQVDDYPYGGGRGAILQCDPLYRCWCAVCDDVGAPVHTIFLSACGKTFNQEKAKQLAGEFENIILVCGHYEGIDQRFIDECVDEEVSLGDFVLTGGELPAMMITDAVSRLVPGVLGDEVCFTDESHWDGSSSIRSTPDPTSGTVWRCRGAALGRPSESRPLAQKTIDSAHDVSKTRHVPKAALSL